MFKVLRYSDNATRSRCGLSLNANRSLHITPFGDIHRTSIGPLSEQGPMVCHLLTLSLTTGLVAIHGEVMYYTAFYNSRANCAVICCTHLVSRALRTAG